MEYSEQSSKDSWGYGAHDTAINNVPGLSGVACQQANTYSIEGANVNRLRSGSFLAGFNETKSESSINLVDDLTHCKPISETMQSQKEIEQASYEPDTKDDCISESNSSYSILSLFPFVCGICDKNFDSLPKYYEHLTLHNEIQELLHCCSTPELNKRFYTCGICRIMYPSLCMLYEHILNVEKLDDFVYKSSDKTVYAFKEDNDIVMNEPDKTKLEEKCSHERDSIEVEERSALMSETSMDVLRNKSVCTSLPKYRNIRSRKSVKQKADGRKKTKEHIKGMLQYLNTKEKKLPKQVVSNNDNPVSDNIKEAKRKEGKLLKLKAEDSMKTHKRKLTRLQCSTSPMKKVSKGKTSVCDNYINCSVKDEKTDDKNDEMIAHDNDEDDEDDDVIHAEYNDDTDVEDNDEFKNVKTFDEVNELDGTNQTLSATSKKKITNIKDEYFPCEICGGFYKHQNLQKHISIHDDRNFACDQCPVAFKSQIRLNAHKRQVHVVEKKFTCDVCGKSFKAWPYLKQHRLCHVKSRDIECPYCPMKFQFQKILRAHLVTHSDDKPYRCDVCDRTFKRVDRLNIHRKTTHSDERNFTCPKCNKAFKTKTDMNRHHRTHLPPRHICHVCGKGFVQKCNMRIHLKVHGIFQVSNTKQSDEWIG